MRVRVRCLLLTAMLAASAMGADPPYAGKWKLNPGKSDFGGITITCERTPGFAYRVALLELDESFTFKTDGKEYAGPLGMTTVWKPIGANAWNAVFKSSGRVIHSETVEISSGGDILTVSLKGMKPDDSIALQRISGGPGLAGMWKYRITTPMSTPEEIEISPKGTDGLTFINHSSGAVCKAKFDGKDYPLAPPAPSDFTCAIARKGAGALEITFKVSDKPMGKNSYTASTDGRSLTVSSIPLFVAEGTALFNTAKQASAVYERQ